MADRPEPFDELRDDNVNLFRTLVFVHAPLERAMMRSEKTNMRSAKEPYDRMRQTIARGLREHASLFLLTAAIALALKQHYSQAGSDDLTWILRPTAWLVERWSGMSFEWEPRGGFVNYARRIVIAPACAGVNFLIVTFSMAAFAGLVRLADKR